MYETGMNAREINSLVSKHPAVVMDWTAHDGSPCRVRIIRARTRGGLVQVHSLSTGAWIIVPRGAAITGTK